MDFRTPNELPSEISLTRVKLRSKKIVNLADLILEPWDHFSEIPCDSELLIPADDISPNRDSVL